MLKKITFSSIALTGLLLTACNGSDEQTSVIEKPMAKFSLGVSDAPVNEAEIVSIEIDSIKLTNNTNQQEVTIDEFTNDEGNIVASIQVNLLDFTGSNQMKIIDEAQGVTLDSGIYSMELSIIDAGSYVVLNNDANEYAIKVPGSRLKLGDFSVTTSAAQVDDKPGYTVEFDLTQSLVLRGNDPAKNGYIIKPHGVRIVSSYGDISGIVSPENTNLGACMVYLYSGEPTTLADLFDSNDETFIGNTPTVTPPVAATTVAVDGSYNIGFISEGKYTVALRCNTDIDDNIQYDELIIPSPAGNSTTVTVTTGSSIDVDF